MTRHTTTVEIAGKICGVSRGVAYEQARHPDGAIPIVRLGRRIVVPVSKLAETLGTSPEALSQTIEALEAAADVGTDGIRAPVLERSPPGRHRLPEHPAVVLADLMANEPPLTPGDPESGINSLPEPIPDVSRIGLLSPARAHASGRR